MFGLPERWVPPAFVRPCPLTSYESTRCYGARTLTAVPAPCAVRPNSEELEATSGLFIIQPRLAIRGQGLDGLVNQRVAVIELCQPDHAGEILADDRAKLVTSMMP